MLRINHVFIKRGEAFGELHLHHAFKFMAGTSTGGLICSHACEDGNDRLRVHYAI